MTTFRIIALGLMLCGNSMAKHGGNACQGKMRNSSASEKTLEGEKRMGGGGSFESNRRGGNKQLDAETRIRKCGKLHNLTDEEIEKLVASIGPVLKEQLPSNCVCIKIEEGLAKNVEIDRIVGAVKTRTDFLLQAKQLLERHNSKGKQAGGAKNSARNRLTEGIGMAMESGVSASVFESVLEHSAQLRIGRILPIIEAAELLQLAGLSSEQIQQLLTNFVDRDLKPREVSNAVEQVLKELAKGKTFDEIFAALWPESPEKTSESK